MMAWLVESFPPDARLTSVAIGYNVAQAIMGGATPSLATIMADVWYASPGFLLSAIALCSLFGLHCVAPKATGEQVLLPQDEVSEADSVSGAPSGIENNGVVSPFLASSRGQYYRYS